MNLDAAPFTVILMVVFAIGVRDTWRLLSEYRAIAPVLLPRYRAIGRAFVVAAAGILVVIGWFGFLTTRRLLGFEAFEWSAPIGLLLSIPVLLLPTYFRRVWDRIGHPPAPGTRIGRRKR